jgi:hypothetical protein
MWLEIFVRVYCLMSSLIGLRYDLLYA